jgi:hypothetical protein
MSEIRLFAHVCQDDAKIIFRSRARSSSSVFVATGASDKQNNRVMV